MNKKVLTKTKCFDSSANIQWPLVGHITFDLRSSSVFSLFSAKFLASTDIFLFWPTFSDLQLRIILIIDKLKDNCEKSEQL